MESDSFKYYAFISYSHKDKKIAQKLQKRLEDYHLPSALIKSNPALPKKLSPIFRDESDLTGGILKETLQANLDRSNYLIVICSPDSAKSSYVNDEVDYFINTLHREDHIIPLIVGGVPHSGGDTECFPQAILNLPREKEILGIDLQVFGMKEAFVRVIATLLKLDIYSFVSRYRKENKRKAVIFGAALIAIFMAVIVLMSPPYSPPYDETLAENVMSNSLGAYVNAGSQYENLRALTDCAINSPDNFASQLELYKNHISLGGIVAKNSLQVLNDMMESGKVMPYSHQPMRKKECAELLTLADTRKAEYEKFAAVLEYVMTDDYAKTFYGSQYPELLLELLSADAKIAAELYQIVITSNLYGKFADESPTAKTFKSVFASVPRQNEYITSEDVKQSSESLARVKEVRNNCLMSLNTLGVFDSYREKYGHEPGIPAPQNASADNKPSATQPEDRLLNDLLGYIYCCERMYSDILWTVEYIERFDRERSWKNLQLARASVSIASSSIKKYKLPEHDMTSEDMQIFMKRKIDVSFLANSDEAFEVEQKFLMNCCVNLNNAVMREVFLQEDWSIYMRYVENLKKAMGSDFQFLANTADWVLASLSDPASTQKFKNLLAQHCPKTHEYQKKKPKSTQHIEALASDTLDDIEHGLIEWTKITGAARNRRNIFEYGLQKNDMDLISSHPMKISDMPALLPAPQWWNDSDINYFWKDSNGNPTIPASRSQLTGVPSSCMIRINGVSLEQVKDYQKYLESCGIKGYGAEKGSKHYLLYRLKGGEFNIVWENESVIIHMDERPVCFIPNLYLFIWRKAGNF